MNLNIVLIPVVILGTNLIYHITLISINNTTTTVKRVVSLRWHCSWPSGLGSHRRGRVQHAAFHSRRRIYKTSNRGAFPSVGTQHRTRVKLTWWNWGRTIGKILNHNQILKFYIVWRNGVGGQFPSGWHCIHVDLSIEFAIIVILQFIFGIMMLPVCAELYIGWW